MKIWTGVVAGLALALLAGMGAGPGLLEQRLNRVLPGYRPASARALALHRKLFIADLHADTLLWNRDLLTRGDRGHVDVPRLIEGNVGLQGFTVVTRAPWGLNMHRNSDATDLIGELALLERWPTSTWKSCKARALYQAERFRQAAARSGGKLTPIRSAAELRAYLERRGREPGITAGFLGIEGATALDGDVANLQALYDAGFRMMSPTHFTDNTLAGSATGTEKGGLTADGRRMVREMEARGMLVDLSHTSPRTVDDVLAMARRPVLVSHTGLAAICPAERNLTDNQVRRIAAAGGLIGIAYFPAAVCGNDARAVARSIRHAVDVAGVDHVALGSDFDGAVAEPFDVAGLPALTGALLEAQFSEDEIARILGGNTERFLLANLP